MLFLQCDVQFQTALPFTNDVGTYRVPRCRPLERLFRGGAHLYSAPTTSDVTLRANRSAVINRNEK